MEEIKYRLWDKVSKKMFYGIGVWNKPDFVPAGTSEMTIVIQTKNTNNHPMPMQYIGLKDNSNPPKEIYEGDIIRYKYKYDRGSNVGIVKFNQIICQFGLRVGYRWIDFGRHGRNYRVIGNICENPELFKEQ